MSKKADKVQVWMTLNGRRKTQRGFTTQVDGRVVRFVPTVVHEVSREEAERLIATFNYDEGNFRGVRFHYQEIGESSEPVISDSDQLRKQLTESQKLNQTMFAQMRAMEERLAALESGGGHPAPASKAEEKAAAEEVKADAGKKAGKKSTTVTSDDVPTKK